MTVENVPCGSVGVTCAKSVTVKIEDDVYRLTKEGEVMVNNKDTPFNIPGHHGGKLTSCYNMYFQGNTSICLLMTIDYCL